MTASPMKGRAVGVLAVPAAASERHRHGLWRLTALLLGAPLGKTATRITTRSELRDEISMAPSSGIGRHAILSPRYRRAPRRATISNKLAGSAYPAAAPPSPCPKPGSHAAGPFPPDRPHSTGSAEKSSFVFGIKPGPFWSSHRKLLWT